MLFHIVCAWCGKEMGVKEYPGSMAVKEPITLSICQGCKAKVVTEIEQMKKGGAECAMTL